MEWRAVFSTIYEVVISPRQAQVSFHSVGYANVMLFCVEDDAEYVYLLAWTFTTIGGLRSRSAEKNYSNPAAAVLAQRILSQKTSKGTQTDAKKKPKPILERRGERERKRRGEKKGQRRGVGADGQRRQATSFSGRFLAISLIM